MEEVISFSFPIEQKKEFIVLQLREQTMKPHQRYRKYRHPRLIRKQSNLAKRQTQTQHNGTSPHIPSATSKQEQGKTRTDLTNYELFLGQPKTVKHSCPSSFQLIRALPHVPAADITLTHLSENNFPVLMYKIKELISFSVRLLQTSTFMQCNFSQKNVEQLVTSIAVNYNAVSYHNYSHAFSLALLNYQCLAKQGQLRSQFNDEEYFYILVAGLAHDLGHKGTNNHFEVKRQSQLAKQFNNQSVLENMHLQTFWNILKEDEENSFLAKSSDPAKAKKIITRLILSTDMSYHFKNIEALKEQVQLREGKVDKVIEGKGKKQEDDKWFMAEQLFHACDLGNPCLEYDNYINWAALLSHEFNQQAVLESEMGLEVTGSFVYHDLSSLYKDQIWFVGNVVQPLWKQLSLTWPSMQTLLTNIETNITKVQLQLQNLQS